jgi:hypothetical protein
MTLQEAARQLLSKGLGGVPVKNANERLVKSCKELHRLHMAVYQPEGFRNGIYFNEKYQACRETGQIFNQ